MPEAELSLLFIRPLNRIGVRYPVSGRVAAILYGEPRLTHDVDFVIFLQHGEVSRLRDVFSTNDFYVPPLEVIHAELAREQGGHFNVIHIDTGFKADFYPAGHDEFHAWALRDMRRMDYRGEAVAVDTQPFISIPQRAG